MDRRAPPPVLTSTGSSGRLPAALVLVATITVLTLVVKPWGTDDAGPSPSEALAQTDSVARPPPTVRDVVPDPARSVDPEAVAAADLAADCLDPLGWRVYTIARWGRGTVRIWSAATPVDATGPADPAIPFVPVVADAVLGLGYCAPVAGPDRPAPTVPVALWHLGPDGPLPLSPGRLRPRAYTILGALYGAPETVLPGPPGGLPTGSPTPATLPLVPAWPSGRYVFDVGGRWFGAAVSVAGETTSAAAPSPSPPG